MGDYSERWGAPLEAYREPVSTQLFDIQKTESFVIGNVEVTLDNGCLRSVKIDGEERPADWVGLQFGKSDYPRVFFVTA